MLSSLKKLAALAIVAASMNSYAQGLALGHPNMNGSGCPMGTASATLSPDSSTLSILFDSFQVEAGPGVGKTIGQKSCNIAVPIQVPNGYSFSIIAVDYRGFVSLPQRATAQLRSEYFLGAGNRGIVSSRQFVGRQDTSYLVENRLGMEAVVWSPCGASTNLRVNTSMMVRNTGYEDALATVDSIDMNAGIIYHIQMRRCF